jgi:exopolyphosphatase / guanosine-5'-triphosphate,3'-diphosphate pyrophosphatase
LFGFQLPMFAVAGFVACETLQMMSVGPVAAIDIGTNTVKLLIVDSDGTYISRRAITVRLGEGITETGRLSEAAIERTLEALGSFRQELNRYGVAVGRVFATSASRDAQNREELFIKVADVVGRRPDLLSGADEGRMSWKGGTSWAEPRFNNYGEPLYDLLIDIGGGSTEFVVGQPGSEPVGVWSIDVGHVRMTDLFVHSNPPDAVELSGLITVMYAHLDDVEREIPIVKQADRLIGVAGTIKTIAAVEIGMHTYDREKIHKFELTKAAVEDVFRTVSTESHKDRAFNPGLPPGRVKTIVAGTGILASIMRHFKFESCTVSETDILDGAVSELLGR